jgi:thiol-disulfide isomerase/thioredoxin
VRLWPLALALGGCLRATDPNAKSVGDGDADADRPCDGTEGFALGNHFEGFTFTSCENTSASVTYADVPAGDVLLFNVSAGWCQPCIEETPGFETFYEAHREEGFSLVQVLYEDENHQPVTEQFCERWRNGLDGAFPQLLTFTVLLDPGSLVLPTMFEDLVNLPQSIAVDRNGCVVGTWTGAPTNPDDPEATLEGIL